MQSVFGAAMLRSGNTVRNISKAAGPHATFLQAASFATDSSPEETWQELFNSPSEWEDLRPLKAAGANPKLPDFCKKRAPGSAVDGERPPALWLDSRKKPAWVADKLSSLAVQAVQQGGKASSSGGSNEAQWKSLFDNPSEWEDLRPIKEAGGPPQLPDFRKVGSASAGQSPALWIDSRRLPKWVAEKLPSLHVEPAQ